MNATACTTKVRSSMRSYITSESETENDLDIRKIYCIRCEWSIIKKLQKGKNGIFAISYACQQARLISEMKRNTKKKQCLKEENIHSFYYVAFDLQIQHS